MSHILYLHNRSHTTDTILMTHLGVATPLSYLNAEQRIMPCLQITLECEDVDFDFNNIKSALIEYLDDYHAHFGGLPMDFSVSIDDDSDDIVFSYDHMVSFLTPEEFEHYIK